MAGLLDAASQGRAGLRTLAEACKAAALDAVNKLRAIARPARVTRHGRSDPTALTGVA